MVYQVKINLWSLVTLISGKRGLFQLEEIGLMLSHEAQIERNKQDLFADHVLGFGILTAKLTANNKAIRIFICIFYILKLKNKREGYNVKS